MQLSDRCPPPPPSLPPLHLLIQTPYIEWALAEWGGRAHGLQGFENGANLPCSRPTNWAWWMMMVWGGRIADGPLSIIIKYCLLTYILLSLSMNTVQRTFITNIMPSGEDARVKHSPTPSTVEGPISQKSLKFLVHWNNTKDRLLQGKVSQGLLNHCWDTPTAFSDPLASFHFTC